MHIINNKKGLIVNTDQCKQIRILDNKWIEADDITVFESDNPEEVDYVFFRTMYNIRNKEYVECVDELQFDYRTMTTWEKYDKNNED